MTDLSRRSFLRGMLTVAALSVAPALAIHADLPRIVGDGIHDDTVGLQAALDGRPFVCEGNVVCDADHVYISGGNYRLTNGLRFNPDRVANITHARFDAKAVPEGQAVFYAPAPKSDRPMGHISNCCIEGMRPTVRGVRT